MPLAINDLINGEVSFLLLFVLGFFLGGDGGGGGKRD